MCSGSGRSVRSSRRNRVGTIIGASCTHTRRIRRTRAAPCRRCSPTRSRPGSPPFCSWNDYRCILHAHAEDSAHTGGTLPEMLADAKQAGIAAILLTDHFRPPRDFIDGRWRGMKDGVLFIPGSEARGFLVYPEHSILKHMEEPAESFVKTVTARDGMIFLSHIEERQDQSTEGLTGLE